MLNSISSLNQFQTFSPSSLNAGGVQNNSQVDFQQLLNSLMTEVSELEHQAQNQIEDRLMGKDVTSAEVYANLRKADLALRMMMQVRNKLLSAFQEIQQMRM